MGGREEFLQIWQQHITRPGSEKLLDWLDHKTDSYDKYPLAVKLHIADLEATYLMEHRTSAVR